MQNGTQPARKSCTRYRVFLVDAETGAAIAWAKTPARTPVEAAEAVAGIWDTAKRNPVVSGVPTFRRCLDISDDAVPPCGLRCRWRPAHGTP